LSQLFISLGSNIPPKADYIGQALKLIVERGIGMNMLASHFYQTPPWGKTDQDWFLNACAVVETTKSPEECLDALMQIEEEMGRVRKEHWGPRVIDLDILLYDNVRIYTDKLKVPHPYMLQRAFVLVPLAEIVPEIMIEGKKILDWMLRLDCSGIQRWE
jgi:2-amino-4-hydroxy-6-hydroxymethyldihydropteridine diphosphokinase